jgi:hypothetical protein
MVEINNLNLTLPESFLLAVEVELERNPGGISEYDLMQALKEQGYFDFLSSPAMPHEIFRAHFILFHALYLMRDQFYESKTGALRIEALNIQLLPYQTGKQNLQDADNLRTFYLDLKNLHETSEDDVYEMLASFWKKYQGVESRESALAELGLQDPVKDKVIKQSYRRLAMQYHPDRGGDNEKLQKINDAIKLLLG